MTSPKPTSVDNSFWDHDGDADAVPGSAARPVAAEPFQSVLQRTMERRTFLKGAAVAGATLVATPLAMFKSTPGNASPFNQNPASRLSFLTVPPGNEPDVVVPPNYAVDVILRWGDPLNPDAPDFDVNNQTAATQAQQFGFNADLVLWYPLPSAIRRRVEAAGILRPQLSRAIGRLYPRLKDRPSRRALMIVNHEYTTAGDMFPGYDSDNPTQTQVEVEIEAHGYSIVEIVQDREGRWTFDRSSPFNRRATGSTPIEISGPLRGNDFLKTSMDPDGTEVLGTLNNCAGGKTPWGTILTCEENFDQYFANFEQVPADIKALSERIAAPDSESRRGWERYVSRFDLAQEPNEYNRFGYIVEVDPYDPTYKPKKRTAMGRFKHEGAGARIANDGRVAIYSGDDARFEYVYKFVTEGRYRADNRSANLALLDEGVLYVARFDAGDAEGDEMGTGEWLPLVWEPGNALDQAGFQSQAEVLINTRGASDILGATPMDRPEDIEVSPGTGHVFIVLTNNSRREADDLNEANPRGPNPHGHIIELIEDGNDSAALSFSWNICLKCGDPTIPEHETRFGDIVDPVAAGVSPISDPDNLVHDDDGNLWIATDGQFFSDDVGFGQNDGVFAMPVEGPDRGLLKQFLSGVPGGEICGPEFSGDNRTFFCAIQHPNDGEAFEKIWPLDEVGRDSVSKPSLIAVREIDGNKIGV